LEVFGQKGSMKLSIHGNEPISLHIYDGKDILIDAPLPKLVISPMVNEVVKFLLGEYGCPCFGWDAIESIAIIEKVSKNILY
jgi:hypothetical protein